MTYSLSGNYDGGSSNVFRLTIKKFDQSAGSFSGEFHYLLTSISEPVSGHYHLYGDGRDETVLWFETSGGSWRWEADYVNGSPSFKKWTAKRTSSNGDIETEFLKETA